MSRRTDALALRIELQRARCAAERAELQNTLATLGTALAPGGNALRSAAHFVRAFSAGRAVFGLPLLRTALRLVRERPWLVSAAVGLLGRRRSRVLLLGGAVAIGVAWWLRSPSSRRGEGHATAADGGTHANATGATGA